MRVTLCWLLCGLAGACAPLQAKPSCVEVTIEAPRFGDVASILKVDSTVASFRFDQPVTHLALVIESYPKEPRMVPVARLALELAKPMTEGRFCVQMADQGFLPLGNGAPHQMQLFMQLDCGGTVISSSQSFLKEKFNFSKSLARAGAGTQTHHLTGSRAPVFWLMGNSDNGTYISDDDLEKMLARNKDAYILIAYLELTKESSSTVADAAPVDPTQPVLPVRPVSLTINPLLPPLSEVSSGTVYAAPSKDPPPKADAKKPSPPAKKAATTAKSSKSPKSSKSSSSSSSKKKKTRP